MPNQISAKRIIVTGSSGAGKTTLVELLAPLLSLPVIPELGRQICKSMGYERVGDVPDQEGFKQRILDAQIAEEERLGSFISDRSTIDCWALWQRWNICQAMTYDTESYYEKARAQAQKYTDVIFVPAMFPAVEDGFRWTEPDYQKQMERILRLTLYDWNLLSITHVISVEGAEQRKTEVLRLLGMA